MSEVPVWFEIVSMAVMLLILAFDLILAVKRPHVPTMREATGWILLYVVLALVFAGMLFAIGDAQDAGDFVTGWLTEYSLSIDNIFVFILLLTRFRVPKTMQQEVLMIGIIIALVLRGVFILLGAALIEQFSWIFYIFGAWLLWTAIQQVRGEDDSADQDNALIRMIKRRGHFTDEFHGMKFRVSVQGRRVWTPVAIVVLSMGTTDLLFALDSIPAIFGITQNPFLVFAANVFALMGLRQLYFLLGGLLEKLKYLHYGIAFILGFIGVKLVFHALHANEVPFINGGQPVEWVPDISTTMSLLVIVASMAVATVASLIASGRDRRSSRANGSDTH
ncbi:MAG TPA: TerC/Alx family metal homeostasis membrane protein [Pseudoclavibacter sp.]|nr:TerC/Alx family metal homeostasis membrane protein [Pseudoclavibacter sp.]